MRTMTAVAVAILAATAGIHAQGRGVAASVPEPRWVRIPAGTFEMGCVPADPRCEADERPRHSVTLGRAFDLMATETTVEMYFATMKTLPDEAPPWSTRPDQPIAIVTWNDAQAFCEAVAGRLPTEAEWEYAARAGRNGAIYPWGDAEPTEEAAAENGAAFESDRPQPADHHRANAFGLHAMAGNVWEWVADWSGKYSAEAVTDPRGPLTGAAKIVRGGSYGDDSVNLRASNRSAQPSVNRNINIGFRCARDVRVADPAPAVQKDAPPGMAQGSERP
jgi:formylglycine-generating enzyme required for sulfatase activity